MEEAYRRTYESIIASLSQSFFEYIDKETVDIDALLKNMIETSVNWNKERKVIAKPVGIEK